jgi:Uma2 family endonuclease
MAKAALVSVEEYLHTSYEDGDREYVDGEVQERNLGEVDHSDLQTLLAIYLGSQYRGLLWIGVEVRVQVKARRFRVPDVTIVFGPKPGTRIVQEPPFIVVEVLSTEDRAARVQEKIADYIEFGVPNIWVLDPKKRTAVAYTREGIFPVFEGVLRATSPLVEVPMSELFPS